MAKTLQGAKPQLEKDLYNAFYNAYMTQYNSNSADGVSDFDSTIKGSMEAQAQKFSDALSKGMATAIYDFVKEIGIDATVSGTVIAPSGPCAGTIPQTSFVIS